MDGVKSLSELLGNESKPEKASAKRVAVSQLRREDFPNAPEWFVKKYFTNASGQTCSRMRVRKYARLGAPVTVGGLPVLNKRGGLRRLTTSYLAELVGKDLEKAGYPMDVHFKGYDLDDALYEMGTAIGQDEFEENESRNVPGLDEEEAPAPANLNEPLDRGVWEWLNAFMFNALQSNTLMYWGVDEDFSKVVLATDFVPVWTNAEFAAMKARLEALQTPETVTFLMGSGLNDFSMFDANDVIRVYTRALRALSGKEYGEPMLDDANLLDGTGALDLDYVEKAMASMWEGEPSCKEEMVARVVANVDPVDNVPDWESDMETNLFDDDTGELSTDLLLAY